MGSSNLWIPQFGVDAMNGYFAASGGGGMLGADVTPFEQSMPPPDHGRYGLGLCSGGPTASDIGAQFTANNLMLASLAGQLYASAPHAQRPPPHVDHLSARTPTAEEMDGGYDRSCGGILTCQGQSDARAMVLCSVSSSDSMASSTDQFSPGPSRSAVTHTSGHVQSSEQSQQAYRPQPQPRFWPVHFAVVAARSLYAPVAQRALNDAVGHVLRGVADVDADSPVSGASSCSAVSSRDQSLASLEEHSHGAARWGEAHRVRSELLSILQLKGPEETENYNRTPEKQRPPRATRRSIAGSTAAAPQTPRGRRSRRTTNQQEEDTTTKCRGPQHPPAAQRRDLISMNEHGPSVVLLKPPSIQPPPRHPGPPPASPTSTFLLHDLFIELTARFIMRNMTIPDDVQMDAKYYQCLEEIQSTTAKFSGLMQPSGSSSSSSGGSICAPFAHRAVSSAYRALRRRITGEIMAAAGQSGHQPHRAESSMISAVKMEQSSSWDESAFIQKHLAVRRRPPHQDWRPQRGLPEKSVSVLKAWLFENFLHPYPQDSEKDMLAARSGLTRNQVANWFINARVRLWKPLIVELREELKRSSGGGGGPAPATEHMMSSQYVMG